jgi:hypothetical protein
MSSEAEEEAEDSYSLFRKHLDWIMEERYEDGPVNWKEFLEDLRRCPDMAFLEMGCGDLCALQYVIVIDNVPLNVVSALLKVNPHALTVTDSDEGWNTLQWLEVMDKPMVSPEILGMLLDIAPELVVEENIASRPSDVGPLYYFVRHNPDSDQVNAILESSDYAVAMLLTFHFLGTEIVPPSLLKRTLNRALEVDSNRIFGLEYWYGEEKQYSLVQTLFEHLDPSNVDLFHSFLKAFVTGREEYARRRRQKRYFMLDIEDEKVDQSSVSCCVLYLLAKLEPSIVDTYSDYAFSFERGKLWQQYLTVCREDITKPTDDGELPLYFAIGAGHQYNPVIRDILKEDMSALETLDVFDEIPPFMVAATATHNHHHCENLLGDDYKQSSEYNNLNTVNVTYELLRANPSMLINPPTTKAKPSVAMAVTRSKDKKRAAVPSNKTAIGDKKSKK